MACALPGEMGITWPCTDGAKSVASPPARAALAPTAQRTAPIIECVDIMNEDLPGTTFRGLPLTDEQDREIKHYIHTRMRNGQPWDTAELEAMLADMLNPPEVADHDRQEADESMAAERTTAEGEESPDTDER